jgi:hypothetical protein
MRRIEGQHRGVKWVVFPTNKLDQFEVHASHYFKGRTFNALHIVDLLPQDPPTIFESHARHMIDAMLDDLIPSVTMRTGGDVRPN